MKRTIKEIIALVKAAPNTASAVRAINKFKRESLFLYENDAPEHGPFVWYPTSDFTFNGLALEGEGEQVFTEFIASVRSENGDGIDGEHVVKFDFAYQLLRDAASICAAPIDYAKVEAFHRAATALALVASEAAAVASECLAER